MQARAPRCLVDHRRQQHRVAAAADEHVVEHQLLRPAAVGGLEVLRDGQKVVARGHLGAGSHASGQKVERPGGVVAAQRPELGGEGEQHRVEAGLGFAGVVEEVGQS